MQKPFARFLVISLLAMVPPLLRAQSPKITPSFEQVISLRSAGSPAISPDGRHVAYTVGSADWKENTFDTEIWLAKEGRAPFQLTNTPKGTSSAPRWSPDGQFITFLADRGNKTQIYVIRAEGGEAMAITAETEGVGSFEWAPDGARLAFALPEKESKTEKSAKERYGAFAVEDTEFRRSHLWLIEFGPGLFNHTELPCPAETDSAKARGCPQLLPKPTRLTEGKFTISNFAWSPDGTTIAVQHQPDPLINSSFRSEISLVHVGSKKMTPLVANPSADTNPIWSPDGKFLLYFSALADTVSNYYKNNQLFKISANGGPAVQLASRFDEQISNITWSPAGIFFVASQKTNSQLFSLDPNSGAVRPVANTPEMVSSASFSKDGSVVGLLARTATSLGEIWKTSVSNWKPVALTQFSAQIAQWNVAQSEVITWKSQDGATIEGVLHKPQDYDPKKKYPLLVVIHGGPTGIDTPQPVPGYVYPVVQWLAKGALVLRPNYRGSAGYGEAFRTLNVQNLGVGDAWDVLSGVDHLAKLGLIDTARLTTMGWSQGGYISAFLTTSSRRFKAVSVGAGISNWMTYYVNTDIHPFTRQYLKATPWQDPKIYEKTSPMSYIRSARTPTLIQHGEFDRRVPPANAYELYQGLQDLGVPSKLIIYKGFGHGITKPKERLAATWHNWQWFNHYLWGEQVEIPVGK